MWGARSSRTVAIGLALTVLLVFCVLPLAYMIGLAAVAPTDGRSIYGVLLLDSRQRALLYNTALLGTGTALSATLVGAPLGVALARVPLPFKTVFRIVLTAPVLLPPYVVGLGWMFLGSRSAWTYSLPGAVLVLTLVLYPLSMLATEVATRSVEPRLEEAALLVARPARVFWRITLPLAARSIAAAALVIFVLAISEFGVPALLRVRVFTTEVFTAFASLYDFGRATVLSFPLLALSFVVAATAVALVGERVITTRRGTAGTRPLAFDEWKSRAAAAAATVVLVAVVLPVIVLVREARGVRSWSGLTEGSGSAILNSLLFAAIGATLVVGVAVWLGYARARAPRRLGAAADALLVVLFAVPSTVVGIGLIGLWNRPGAIGALYGSSAMVVLAYIARFLPVAALGLAASVRQVAVSQEEAAAVAGADWLRTMTHIVLPQITLGVLAAWVIVFVLAFGELGASILVAPPGESTLPIRIYTLIANTPPANVAALALLQSAVIFCALLVLAIALAIRGPR